jgi:hypothetical protein
MLRMVLATVPGLPGCGPPAPPPPLPDDGLVFSASIPAWISRQFEVDGIRKVILRLGSRDSATVTVDASRQDVDVSGLPTGGAAGYHPPDPSWRETPADAWGLDFVSSRSGETLVISTKNEISYIHHHYVLESVVLTVPASIEAVLEARELNGDGTPDLSEP